MAQRMKFHKTAFLAMLLTSLFLNGFFGKALADSAEDTFGAKPDDYIKSRTYIGGFGTSMSIANSFPFDGTLGFVAPANGYQVDLIPSIDRSYGFGVLLGHREGPWAGEFSFWQSYHTATWSGGSGVTFFTTPATYSDIEITFKRYFFTNVPTQPFVSFGMGFPWLQSQNMSAVSFSDLSGASVSSSTLSGLGLDLGVGLEIYLGQDFSLLGGVVHKWNGFNQGNGAAGQKGNFFLDGNPADLTNLEGDGIDFYLGGTFGY
jgi:hypothetical protein